MIPTMRLTVSAKGLDDYPELLDAYKRNLAACLRDAYGVEPDWDTYRRYDYEDDPISPESLRPFAVLYVEGKAKEEQ